MSRSAQAVLFAAPDRDLRSPAERALLMAVWTGVIVFCLGFWAAVIAICVS